MTIWRCRQTNSTLSQLTAEYVNLSGTKLAALGKSSTWADHEVVS
ncbi:hypothetical protein [Tateyamaria sp. Alg231-49]|nr:hypothetical protein [Tateyamaria sp. Alg231-49]